MEDTLLRKLNKIFGLKRSTLASPGEDKEQDVLFVHVTRNKTLMSKNQINYRAEGVLTVYTQGEKMPLGFFHKRIDRAKVNDKKDFFFHSFDENEQYGIQNLCERKVSFVFMASEQYDPEKGQLTELNMEC